MVDYKVTVCCITFNQKEFIARALNGFVMQKTDFPFQVLVGDDASTDGTTEIVREYAEKYPDIIKPVFHEKNIGPFKNSLSLYQKAKTEYVALCDGDDYWTDEKKLQKQVDFLDARPDFSVCFHPVTIHWNDNSRPDIVFPSERERFYKTELFLDDLLKRNFIQTNSVMFRWRFKTERISDYLNREIAPGDYYIDLLHAQTGKIAFLPDIMAVYCRNRCGIWQDAGVSAEWFIRYGTKMVCCYAKIQETFGKDCKEELDEISLLTYINLKETGSEEKIKELYSVYSPPLNLLHYSFLKYVFYSVFSRFCFGRLRKRMKDTRNFLKQIIKILKKRRKTCLTK